MFCFHWPNTEVVPSSDFGPICPDTVQKLNRFCRSMPQTFAAVAILCSYTLRAAGIYAAGAGNRDHRGSESDAPDVERLRTSFEMTLAEKDAELLATHRKLEETLQKLSGREAQLATKDIELAACRSAHTVVPLWESSAAEHRRHSALTAVTASKAHLTPTTAHPSRSMLQVDQGVSERVCSKVEIDSVLRACSELQTQVVLEIFETNMACALCIFPCADKPTVDAVSCSLACLHQNENSCENTTRIAHLIESATLGDRDTLVRMLELSEAVCVYCILETYVFSLA